MRSILPSGVHVPQVPVLSYFISFKVKQSSRDCGHPGSDHIPRLPYLSVVIDMRENSEYATRPTRQKSRLRSTLMTSLCLASPAALGDAARWVARYGRHAILVLYPTSPTSRGGVYRATVNFALGFPAHVRTFDAKRQYCRQQWAF